MTQVKIEKVGDKIHLRAPWAPGLPEKCKSIGGGNWNKEEKFWYYPLTIATCRTMRATFGEGAALWIGPELAEWFRVELARGSYLDNLGKQMDSELTRIPDIAPRMAAAMASRTYQRSGARFIALSRQALLADEVSLGKTIQYLGAVIEAGLEEGTHLITAPKSSIFTTWAEEIRKWTDFAAFPVPDGREKRLEVIADFIDDPRPSKFLIVNPEMVQVKMGDWCHKCQMWSSQKWDMNHFTEDHNVIHKIQECKFPDLFQIDFSSVCVDEAHKYLLGIKNANKKTLAGEGYTRLRTVQGGMRVATTGTPIKGKLLNFWPVLHWLDPENYSSRNAFAKMYSESEADEYTYSGVRYTGVLRDDREQVLYETLKPIMLRRTKKEVQPDLPDDVHLDHWVTMTSAMANAYKELEAEGEAEIDGGTVTATGVLALFTRHKQFSFGPWKMNEKGEFVVAGGSPKVEFLIQALAERGVTPDPDNAFLPTEGGFKYIIASQFNTVLDHIAGELEKLQIETMKITGAVTAKRRIETQRRFQDENDSCRVLLVNTMAGGVALTLDAWCDEMFILDETWVHDEQAQLEGRIRNRDVEKRVATRFFHYVRTHGTIEEDIANSGLSQDEFAKTILDRRRGVKVAKRELGED